MGRVRTPGSSMIVVAFFCCASAARADVIRITSGAVATINVLGQSSPWFLSDEDEMHLEAPGVFVGQGGSLTDVSAFLQLTNPPTTVAQGAPFDASGVLHVENIFSASFNDEWVPVTAPFTMTFDASPMRVACGNAHGSTECTGSAPFTFHADLTARPPGGVSVVHHLVGGGIVEGRLISFGGSDQFGAVRYDFGASPTPEPATLSLFAAGALMAMWRRRKQA